MVVVVVVYDDDDGWIVGGGCPPPFSRLGTGTAVDVAALWLCTWRSCQLVVGEVSMVMAGRLYGRRN